MTDLQKLIEFIKLFPIDDDPKLGERAEAEYRRLLEVVKAAEQFHTWKGIRPGISRASDDLAAALANLKG